MDKPMQWPGSVQVGGFGDGKSGSRIQKNRLNAGRVPNGAIVERPIATRSPSTPRSDQIAAETPDFTAARNNVDQSVNEI